MYSDQTNNLDFNTFYSTTAPVSKVIHGNQMNFPPPSVRRDLSSPFSSFTLQVSIYAKSWGKDNRYIQEMSISTQGGKIIDIQDISFSFQPNYQIAPDISRCCCYNIFNLVLLSEERVEWVGW